MADSEGRIDEVPANTGEADEQVEENEAAGAAAAAEEVPLAAEEVAADLPSEMPAAAEVEADEGEADQEADTHVAAPVDGASEVDSLPPPTMEVASDPTNASVPVTNDKLPLPVGAPAVSAAALVGGDQSVAVRFTARPEGFYFVEEFPVRAPCLLLYKRMETQLHVDSRQCRLYFEGRPLTEMDVLGEVCVVPDDGLPLMLDLEFDNVPDHLRALVPGDQAVRSVSVKVHYGADIPPKDFFVTMVKGYDRKPFLGGFKHKRTPAVYHNATTQCSTETTAVRDMSGKLSRTTQTQGVTRSCQTQRECGTQMRRPDLIVDETYDRVVVARPYFSADRLLVLQTQKTIQLQAFVRGWRARKIAKQLRNERDAERAALEEEDVRRKQDHHQKRLEEIGRRTHPRTTQDFNVLQNELEAWRLQEVKRIEDADLSEDEKRLAMMELLKKQTKLLQTIDRLQIQAQKENRAQKINTTLNKMSSAKSWGTKSAVHVETPFTIRARELRDLYNGLLLAGLTIDERLDILLHVKWTVKEFECALSREIVELVDREADLLNRGRKDSSLSGLRQRLANLFLQFVETPEFNPEAVQYQRVPLEYTSRPLVKLDRK